MSSLWSNGVFTVLLLYGLSIFGLDSNQYKYIKIDGIVYRLENKAYLDLIKRRPDIKISIARIDDYKANLKNANCRRLKVYLLADEFHTPVVDLGCYKNSNKEGLYTYIHVYRNISVFKGGTGVWVPIYMQFLDWGKLPSDYQFKMTPREWKFNYGNVVEEKLTAEGEYKVTVTSWYHGYEEMATSNNSVFTWTPD